MDPLRLAIALTPLAAYLLLVGLLNARGKPIVVTGAADTLAVGLALAGFAWIGPLALFRPEAATAQVGAAIWAVLLTLYGLWALLLAMLARPRLVIYNLAPEDARPLVAEAMRRIDPAGRWVGDCVVMPTLGVQLSVEGLATLATTSLVANGSQQDPAGWRRLTRGLDRAMRDTPAKRWRPRGVAIAGLGLTLLAAALWSVNADPAAIGESWRRLTAF